MEPFWTDADLMAGELGRNCCVFSCAILIAAGAISVMIDARGLFVGSKCISSLQGSVYRTIVSGSPLDQQKIRD